MPSSGPQKLRFSSPDLLRRIRQRQSWRIRWESTKNDALRWSTLRDIYAELKPDIFAGRCDPYFIDWISVFTPIEFDMWHYIRSLGLPFYPQYPVSKYFVDFADPVKRIAIECDGKKWHNKERDAIRDNELSLLGWSVARFTGHECYVDTDHPDSAYHRMLMLQTIYRDDTLDNDDA